ncbi:MAG: 4-alpha-glucanotransferase [Burkholderiales bacterium]
MNEALMRLAGMAGIENGYWDGLGGRRDLQEPTAAALLAALDFNLSDDANAQCRSLADQAFLFPLPPCVVIRLGAPMALVMALPSQQRDETIAWELVLESGERSDGEFVPARLTQVDEREIDGVRYSRFSLPLGADVPSGYHQFRLPSLACATTLIVGPARCFIPAALVSGTRRWGLAIQLYTLRSSRNWGIGDFGDLAALATAAGHAGTAFIGLNPLHARHLARPDEASPYSPSSRLFLDPVYIDVEAVEELSTCPDAIAAIASSEFQAQVAKARIERLVDYPAVAALKLTILERLFRCFQQRATEPDNARAIDFRTFKQYGSEPLARFAEFEALRLHLLESTGSVSEWREWPQEFRDPEGAGLVRFRRDAAERIEFQIYLQWVAAEQLQNAARSASVAGMSIGLYRDLAVGAAEDSAETWSEQYLFARGISVGAPPDMLNRQGQTWGLPPWNPRTLARQGYAPFRRLLSANMRNAGALRIDHVMALTRLFWIPKGMNGADGGYVRNAFEELAVIVALESERNRCMVIGEDLGSVPDGFRSRLHDGGFLSYRVMVYERHWHGDGRFCHPEEYPPQSLATVATHDMPTITEYWRGDDIARRAQLGIYPGPQQRDEDAARRHDERAGILRLLGEVGLSPADPSDARDVVGALHSAVARTRSMLAVVQLDDLVGESEPVNIPGTHREYPNWRRKLSLPIEEIFSDERWSQLAAVMREAGRSDPAFPA